MIYRDRVEAGKRLAERLADYADRPGVLVLALPRGGVPVAFEVAGALHASLDIFLVRKLGVPGHEELAMGAIATGGVRVLNEEVVNYLHIPGEVIDAVAADELRELERRERAYRGDRPAPDVKGKTVILVDDGLATGSTMRAAAAALRRQQPARIVVAVPVSAPQTCDEYRMAWTRSSAPSRRSRFTRSGSGTKTSRRRPTRRCANCSRAPRADDGAPRRITSRARLKGLSEGQP
jgi:putative phosphoribosyl transferase